jgi:hypothetical protein
MKKSFLLLLSLFLFSSFSVTSHASAATEERIEPIKTEQLILEDGTVIPVYYFVNPEDGDKHREQMANSYNPLSQLNSLSENSESTNSPAAILDSYSLVSYGGTLNYNYDVQYTYNATDVAIPWKPTVTRSTSSQTSIKVSGGFDKAFQAEVGKTFATTESWSHAFDISIPKKTQYEIWTWNVAEYWTFKVQPFVGSSSNFAVYRPTSTYGHSIYVFDYPRDPR